MSTKNPTANDCYEAMKRHHDRQEALRASARLAVALKSERPSHVILVTGGGGRENEPKELSAPAEFGGEDGDLVWGGWACAILVFGKASKANRRKIFRLRQKFILTGKGMPFVLLENGSTVCMSRHAYLAWLSTSRKRGR